MEALPALSLAPTFHLSEPYHDVTPLAPSTPSALVIEMSGDILVSVVTGPNWEVKDRETLGLTVADGPALVALLSPGRPLTILPS